MLLIHQLSFYLHIAIGSCALMVFWIPVFTRKGNLDHKRFGRYFASAMYIVAASGFLMSSLDLLFPLSMHADGIQMTLAEEREAIAEIRSFAIFLFSLSILVFTSTRQGWLAIQVKEDRQALRTPVHTFLCLALVLVGISLFVTGIIYQSVLFMVFSVLQVVIGLSNLRYNFKTEHKPKQWWIEHLRGLIGSGIGAYTAFFVFGGRRIFDSIFSGAFADASLILWVAPGVIGGIAIAWLSRHYESRFSGEWAIKRARTRVALLK